MSKEAMKLAVSVLKGAQEYKRGHTTFVEAVEELEEALAEQPAQQEPVAFDDADIYGFWARNKEAEQPAQRKPLTDEQFLELLLKTGTTELVSWATFVGGSIQMQGKIGLLRGAKLLKEFVEAAHGIKENT